MQLARMSPTPQKPSDVPATDNPDASADGQSDADNDTMSDTSDVTADAPYSNAGEVLDAQYDGFTKLDVAHLGGLQYAVLSPEGGASAYQVDVNELACSCPADEYRSEEDEERNRICKHLAKALLVAPERQSVEEAAFNDLATIVSEAERAAETVRELRDVTEAAHDASVSASADAADSDDADGDGGDDGGSVDPVERTRKLLDANGHPDVDELNVWEDDGEVHVEIDGFIEDFDAHRDATDAVGLSYDGDHNTAAVSEVVGA